MSPEAAPALDRLLAPRGIAIVGASDRSGWSTYTFANLRTGGYRYPVHLVNRRGGTVHGQPAVPSLRDIDGPVELAYVLTGPDTLPTVLEDAAARTVPAVDIVAAGFAEVGPEGRRRQDELVRMAGGFGITVLGPNNLGFINTVDGVYCWSQAMPWPIERGGVAILSQSGALGIFLLQHCQSRDVGISHLVSVGNEAHVSVDMGIDFLAAHEAVSVVALYVESVRHPEAFLAACERARRAGKPVVVYKAGRGALGPRVAAAHTGGLVGDDRVVDAVLAQHGVVRAASIEDWVATAGFLASYPPLGGGRTGFVTASGAMCGVISDTADSVGLEVPDLAPATVATLRDILPEFATPQNPLDTTGYIVTDRSIMPRSQAAMAADPNLDVLVVHTVYPQDPELAERMAAPLGDFARLVETSPVPVVPMGFFPTEQSAFARAYRRERGLPFALESFGVGIAALRHAVWWAARRDALAAREARTGGEGQDPSIADPGAGGALTGPPPDASGAWDEHRAGALLSDLGVPVVPGRLATTPDEAAAAAASYGGAVAVKVVSPSIAHKSDVGGVRLALHGADAARRAVADIAGEVARRAPGASVSGYLVSPMRTGGLELLVGVVSDPLWGKVMAVGLGGVFTEVLQDAALRRLPVDEEEAAAMLASLRAAPLLAGYRSQPAADVAAVAAAIAAISRAAERLGPRLAELEVNPLWVSGAEVEALDVHLRWA